MDSKYTFIGKENQQKISNELRVKRIKLCTENSKVNGLRVTCQNETAQSDLKEAFVEDFHETRKSLPVYAVRLRFKTF